MAIKDLIGPGIGFSPGGVKYLVLRGLSIGASVSLVTDAGWVAKRRLAHYSAEERQLLDYTARKRLIEWSAPHDD